MPEGTAVAGHPLHLFPHLIPLPPRMKSVNRWSSFFLSPRWPSNSPRPNQGSAPSCPLSSFFHETVLFFEGYLADPPGPGPFSPPPFPPWQEPSVF